MNGANRFLALYGVVSVVHLLFLAVKPELGMFTKPLLLPLLLIYFIRSVGLPFKPFQRLTVIALILGWCGDVLLMFSSEGEYAPMFFLLGLSAFLSGHLFYILAFRAVGKKYGITSLAKSLVVILAYILLGVLLVMKLWPDLPDGMQFPVIFYAVTILLMGIMAYRVKPGLERSVWGLIMAGAMLFIISDSIIGLSRFSNGFELPYTGVWIMLTYTLAQGLLVVGIRRIQR